MNKRGLCLILVILFAVSLTTGCQKAGDIDDLQLREESTEKEVLTLFMPADGIKSDEANVYKEVISEYNKQRNDVNLIVDGMPTAEGFNEALEKRLESGGEGADLFIVNADSVKPLNAKGFFYDLSDLPAYGLLNDFARAEATVDGTVYAIPLQMTAYGLFVNVGLLKEYNLQPPQNLDEFLFCCQVLKENGITPLSLNRGYAMTCLAMARGLYPVYQAADKESILAGLNDGSIKIGDYMLEGFRFFEMLVEEGYYGDNITVEKTKSIKPTTSDLEDFLEGKTAFAVFTAGREQVIGREAPDMEFIQQGFPVLPDGTVCLPAVATRLCVNAKGAHVEEALRAVDYMTSVKAEEFIKEGSGYLPAIRSNKETSVDARILPLYEDAVSQGQIPIEDMSLHFNYWDTIRELCLKIIGGMSPEEAAEEYNRIQAEQIETYNLTQNTGD